MSSITTWISLIVQLLGIAGMIFWNAKKKEWAKNETEKSKIRDQSETKSENQGASQQLSDAEAANDSEREKIRQGLKE